MPERTPDCPKCNARMEPGFMPDSTWGGEIPPTWVAGRPTKAWHGLGALKTKGQARYPVAAYRCPKCGFLELYAAT